MKRKGTNVRKTAAVILAAAMVVSLCACGSSGGNTESQGNSEAGGTTENGTTGSNTESGGTEEVTYDFGGRVFRIGSYYDMTPDPESNAVNAALAERIAYVEENYNCTIEFVDLGEDYVDDYTTSVLAGDPVCDIGYAITTTVLPTLIEGGIAYPISDLGVIDFDSYKWRKDVVDAGYYKGKNYTLLLADPEIRYGIFWNKTLFEQYGLPDLYELYNNGEWNWDKFKEVAQNANVDLDSDGTIDIYGFNERADFAWCYLYSNEAYIADKTETGMTVDLSDNRIIEALTAYQDFATSVNYRSIDWSVDDWDSLILSFQNGTSMMCLEEFWISYMYLNNMSDDWGWVPFPMGNSASEYSCYGKENGCRIILNGVDKPEEVALVYDLITDIADSEEDFNDLLEDQLESWCDDAETVENVSYIYEKGLSKINCINGFSTLNAHVNDMMTSISSGEMTPQTALDTYTSQIETAVSDINTGETTRTDIEFPGNVLTNSSFELDLDGWEVTRENTEAGISRNDADGYPNSGEYSFHYWDDKEFSIDLKQTVTVSDAGSYVLSVYSQGDSETGSSMVLYILDDAGNVLDSVDFANTGWADWQIPTIEISLDAGQTVTVGLTINGQPNDWGTIDDLTFILQ
jgi:multiple sugar transport system substrate-binding protein